MSAIIRINLERPWPWLHMPDRRELRGIIRRLMDAGVLHTFCDLLIYIGHDGAIARLGSAFLHVNGPTNVLSFPDGRGQSGAIYLSMDMLARECHLYGQNPGEHFFRLLCHGLAHLHGYDHGAEMEALEGRLYAMATAVFFKKA